jgi:catechol 2,3-dioxygenase-like lactoylglutathione lyase family enzyme
MISYVTVGADDIAAAKRFYTAFLPVLGYSLEEGPEGLSYALPVAPGQTPVLPDFYVKPTFDGRPASAGNGAMVAFEVPSQRGVNDLHAAAWPQAEQTRARPDFAPHMARSSTSATCATRKETRSPCFPATPMNRAGTIEPVNCQCRSMECLTTALMT